MSVAPGPPIENRCSIHPDEPVSGLCGCGTFFCRKCSTSRIFCGECSGQRQIVIRHNRTAGSGATAAYPAGSHRGPLSSRVIIESLAMTMMLVVAVGMLFSFSASTRAGSDYDDFFTYGINSAGEPLQRQAAYFHTAFATPGGADVSLSGDTSYSVSAKVQSVASYDDPMMEVIPYDLLLSWGMLAEDEIAGKLDWEQSDRRGTVSGSLSATGADIDADYVISHVSNSHVLPANENIARALDTIKPGDTVRIDGMLVDVEMVQGNQLYTVTSSKSRTDQGDGACEIILVERIKINDETWS